MQELTTRRAFVQDVLGEWSSRAVWRGAVYAAVGLPALAAWKGLGGIRVATKAAVLGACFGALFVLLFAAAARIANHLSTTAFWNRLGWWVTALPEDFTPTHALPCGRARWPVQVDGGVLYFGVDRAAFVPYRSSVFGRRVAFGPGVEACLSEGAAAQRWLLPLAPQMLQLRDSSRCARFLVARPAEMAVAVAAIVKGRLSEHQRAAEQEIGPDGRAHG